MKNTIKSIIAIAIAAFSSATASAQIQVNRQDTLPKKWSSTMAGHLQIDYKVRAGEDTTYYIFFRDRQYTQINSFESFTYTGKINDLYDLFKNQIYAEKGTTLDVTVGITNLTIVSNKALGVPFIRIYKGKTNSYFELSQVWLDKMFKR